MTEPLRARLSRFAWFFVSQLTEVKPRVPCVRSVTFCFSFCLMKVGNGTSGGWCRSPHECDATSHRFSGVVLQCVQLNRRSSCLACMPACDTRSSANVRDRGEGVRPFTFRRRRGITRVCVQSVSSLASFAYTPPGIVAMERISLKNGRRGLIITFVQQRIDRTSNLRERKSAGV